VPRIQKAALYVVDGCLTINGVQLEQYHMLTLEHCGGLTVSAAQETRVALIGGTSLGERHIY
jgi:redox-sensitive bicupin YhaK (pirin superfamily)